MTCHFDKHFIYLFTQVISKKSPEEYKTLHSNQLCVYTTIKPSNPLLISYVNQNVLGQLVKCFAEIKK